MATASPLPDAPAVCQTNLVLDAPTAQDQFGPHGRVADAIHTLINESTGGVSIGLAGDYGSGKSTVVRLLQERLPDAGGSRVWIFDTWAHEGDPLRRTFLESLIAHLVSPGNAWIDADRWTKRAEELARRRRVVDTRNYPRLSWVGVLLAASALAIPVGTTVLSNAVRKYDVTLFPSTPIIWSAVLGVLLCLFPLIAFLGVLLTWNLRGRKEDLREVLALFVQKSVADAKTEIVETPEPTSIEFERIFGSLMEEALAVPNRRLVLVVDNLDRVAPSDALTIWSTLQTFLQHTVSRPAWLDRLWIIVPYDRNAIAKLWQKEAENGEGLATAFLDKSFQVRFEVPPPLLSDWRTYLLENLKQALPGHDDSELHQIYRLIAIRRGGTERSPTPREIKVFVNQLGAVHRQHGCSVPLAHMALYVLHRKEHPQVRTRDLIFDSGQPVSTGDRQPEWRLRPAELSLLGPEYKDSLAALEFGVPAHQARQLLLEDPIKRALETGGSADLKELADASTGFWEVLEHSLERALAEWGNEETSNILHAAVALHDSGVLEGVELHRRAAVIAQIERTTNGVGAWLPYSTQVIHGIKVLAEWTNSAATVHSLIKSFGSIEATRARLVQDDNVDAFVEEVLAAASLYREVGGKALEPGVVVIPGALDDLIRIVASLDHQISDSQAEEHYLCVPDKPGDVLDSIRYLVADGKFGRSHFAVVRVLLRCGLIPDWTSLVSALEERLRAYEAPPSKEANVLLASLLHLRGSAEADLALKSLTQRGHLGNHIWSASQSADWETIARCLYAHLVVAPNLQPSSITGNSTAGYRLIAEYVKAPPRALTAELVTIIRSHGKPELLREAIAHPGAQNLAAAAMGILVEMDRADEVFTPDVLIDHWSTIQKNVKPEALMARLGCNEQVAAEILNREFDPHLTALYRVLLNHVSPSTNEDLTQWCLHGLRQISQEHWSEEIDVRGDLYELATQIDSLGAPVALGAPLRDALLQHAARSAAERKTRASHAEWSALFALLSEDDRMLWRNELYEMVKQQSGKISHEFFTIYGRELSHSGGARNDVSFVSHLAVPVVEQRNAPALRWLNDFLRANPGWHRDLPHQYRQILKSALVAQLDSTEDGASSTLREIMKALGFRTSKRKGSEQA